MQYKIRRVDPPARDAIEHGLFGKGGAQKGSTWDNHLYIARQKVGDGWRYFYSQAELRAAQAKQAGKQLTRNATATAKAGVNAVKRTVKNAPSNIRSGLSSAKNSIRSTASSVKTNAGNALNSARSTISDTAAKTKHVLSGQYAKDVDNRIDQIAKDGYDENGRKTMTIQAGNQEEYKDLWDKRNKSLTYKISDGINKSLSSVKDASDKGKAFLDNAVGKAKNTDAYDKVREAATKAADKAQAAADKAMKAAEKARAVANKALEDAKNASSDAVNRAKDIGGKAADRIEETAKRAQQYGNNVANKAKDIGGKAADKFEETAKDVQRYGSNVVNKAKDLGSDAYNKAKNTATDAYDRAKNTATNISNRAQEGLWDARRNVEELADKAKNFATDKTYRNDKTYREMVNGVSSMKQDLKSVNAYIDELMDNGTTTPEARRELRDNIELRRQIEDSLDYVQDEIDNYEKRNK